ncbi:MAG: nucleoside-diphosphate sugar epimerase/dehydratase [Anaerolineae bacterium]
MIIRKGLLQVRNRYFFALDLVIFVVAGIVSFVLRLEPTTITDDLLVGIFTYLILSIIIREIIFFTWGMYQHYWEHAGAGELILSMITPVCSGLVLTVVVFYLAKITPDEIVIPRSIPFIDTGIVTILVVAARFSPRALYYVHHRPSGSVALRQKANREHTPAEVQRRLLIVGAGTTGVQVLTAVQFNTRFGVVVGFLDDDERKVGQRVRGLLVLGKTEDLPRVCREQQINEVIIAIPSAPGALVRQIADSCRTIGVQYKIMPGINELVTGKITVNALRSVSIDDLLRRAPIELDVTNIAQKIANKCVMITGAGGTIGSELARQVARFHPKTLLLLGHGENSLFWTHKRLLEDFPGLPKQILLADVRDMPRLTYLFECWRPDIIFHAAAHKHVAMLETNHTEGVSNNVIGTRNLIELSNRFEVESMVRVDKAVEPTNVMGKTKRIAEMLMIAAAQQHPNRFAVVRFGNVLGSRGSVVPVFQQQIAAGGPVFVTDRRMTRFFMSIPEAVLLVLKASVLSAHSSLFVLNMGEPVKIVDLAHDLIRLSGLQPEHDIQIKEIGPYPGEKMHEELFWSYEIARQVEGGAIYAVELSEDLCQRIRSKSEHEIKQLMQAALDHDEDVVKEMLSSIVFTLGTELQAAKQMTNGNGNSNGISQTNDLPINRAVPIPSAGGSK